MIETLDDGSVEVTLEEPEGEEAGTEHTENLVEYLKPETLAKLGSQVGEDFEEDKNTRSEWERMFNRGLDLLGLKLEQKNDPFKGASSAVHPMIIENCIKFQSRASLELFPSEGPVKTQILGKVTPEKEMKALRVKNYLNYQVRDAMKEYFPDLERLLFNVPLTGSGFKKLYYSQDLGRPYSEFVPADQFVVSNYCTSLETAERYTHWFTRTPNQFKRDVASGLYKEIKVPPSQVQLSDFAKKLNRIQGLDTSARTDVAYELLEQHRYCSFDEFGDQNHEYPSPYVVTVDRHSKQVIGVRRLWKDGDDKRLKLQFFTHYFMIPGMGFYGLGYIHMLGNLAMSATVSLQALLDSAQFSALRGGYKNKNAKVLGPTNSTFAPGEYKDVEWNGAMGDAFYTIQFKDPSPVAFEVYKDLVGSAERYADSTTQVLSESKNYGPVGTILALLDAVSKVPNAIHRRLHASQKNELNILARMARENLPEAGPQSYEGPGETDQISATDFDGVDVIPVSDPNTSTQAHRIAKAQLVYEVAKQAPPGQIDHGEVMRYMFTTAEVPNLERIMPDNTPQPRDPMSDIKAASQGQPVKAFPGQDHDAYISIFNSFVTDPTIAQNQTWGQALAILTAAIRDHQLARWMMQVESVMPQGPGQTQGVPEQIMAEAAQKVNTANKALDPNIGVQSPDMLVAQAALKDADTRERKTESDIIYKAGQISTRNREIDQRYAELALEGGKAGAKHIADVEKSIRDTNTKLAVAGSQRLAKEAKEKDRDAK